MKRPIDRRSDIRQLLDIGWSMAAIARKYRVSRQRIHQIATRNRLSTRKKRHRASKSSLGEVYFCQTESFIKIGWTLLGTSQRVRGIEMACPTPIRLLKTIKGGRDLEAALHQRFAHLRHRGEWFHAGTDLVEFIEK